GRNASSRQWYIYYEFNNPRYRVSITMPALGGCTVDATVESLGFTSGPLFYNDTAGSGAPFGKGYVLRNTNFSFSRRGQTFGFDNAQMTGYERWRGRFTGPRSLTVQESMSASTPHVICGARTGDLPVHLIRLPYIVEQYPRS